MADNVISIGSWKAREELVFHCMCGGQLFYILDNATHKCADCGWIVQWDELFESEDDE